MSAKQLSIFQEDLENGMRALIDQIAALPEAERIDVLNRIHAMLHEISPFREEPVDCVLWVRESSIDPNGYNPNVVYRPEMDLLETSIEEDHYTQPIVTHRKDDRFEIVDGEHRYLAGRNGKIAKRLNGYLPVTVTNTRTAEERMASTIRHNRARGVHKLDSMTNIVLEMIDAGWSDDQISKRLGMDADEILRIKQVSGASKTFARASYNRAWINDDGQESV
jgi:ParB-like chromosome segregation protein Spo0J